MKVQIERGAGLNICTLLLVFLILPIVEYAPIDIKDTNAISKTGFDQKEDSRAQSGVIATASSDTKQLTVESEIFGTVREFARRLSKVRQ